MLKSVKATIQLVHLATGCSVRRQLNRNLVLMLFMKSTCLTSDALLYTEIALCFRFWRKQIVNVAIIIMWLKVCVLSIVSFCKIEMSDNIYRTVGLLLFLYSWFMYLPAATASSSLRFTAPLLAAEHFRLLAFRYGTACYRRLHRYRPWRPFALDSIRSCLLSHILTFDSSDCYSTQYL